MYMNADNKSKAIVLYEPPKRKQVLLLREFIARLNSSLYKYFYKRRKLLLSSLIVFSLFFMVGNCIAAHYLFKLPYILDVLSDEYFIKTFLITYFFVFASGYTIFGSVMSVCFFLLFSFLLGNFSYCGFSLFQLDFKLFVYFAILITASLLLSLFCIESYDFYSHCKTSKKLIFTKQSAVYFIFSLIVFFLLFILLTSITNYFW